MVDRGLSLGFFFYGSPWITLPIHLLQTESNKRPWVAKQSHKMTEHRKARIGRHNLSENNTLSPLKKTTVKVCTKKSAYRWGQTRLFEADKETIRSGVYLWDDKEREEAARSRWGAGAVGLWEEIEETPSMKSSRRPKHLGGRKLWSGRLQAKTSICGRNVCGVLLERESASGCEREMKNLIRLGFSPIVEKGFLP